MSQGNQRELRLPPAPRQQTVEYLYRTHGDVLAPVEEVRARYFPNLNNDNFTRALNAGRVALPVTILDPSTKAPKFIDIRHLAIFIDAQAEAADMELATKVEPGERQ